MNTILIFWLCFAVISLILIYKGVYHHWKQTQKNMLWFTTTLRPSVNRTEVSDLLVPILIKNQIKHAQITYHITEHGLNIKVAAHRQNKDQSVNTSEMLSNAYLEFRDAIDRKDMTMLSKESDSIHL